MIYKEVFGFIAIALTVFAFVPCIRDTLNGTIKPHVFSWVIWGVSTLVVFAAQYADGGGAGAWAIGISGAITSFIACLAYWKKSDIEITRWDKRLFIAAMTALPFWYITSDPLWAVVILTTVDIIGFVPTLCKAYKKPFEEQVWLPAIMIVRNIVSIVALEHYSFTTLLFPVAIPIASLLLIVIILIRRQTVISRKFQ